MGSLSNRRKLFLWLEFLLLFAGAPLLILQLRDRWLTVAILWAGAFGVFLFSRRFNDNPGNHAKPSSRNVIRILLRFLVIGVILTVVSWMAMPESFLSFPRERPGLWILVMLLYPVLSVWPQEMLYRAFIYRRYAPLFGTGYGYMLASAIAFGYMHIIFINSIAVVMSAIGGWLFASNFARNGSLGLVSAEHALYGCLIFTIGLGKFFFTGYAWG